MFGFKIYFKTLKNISIEFDNFTFKLEDIDVSCEISISSQKEKWYKLNCKKFMDEKKAYEFANTIKKTLYWYSFKNKVPISFEVNKGKIGKEFKKEMEDRFDIEIDDLNDINIYNLYNEKQLSSISGGKTGIAKKEKNLKVYILDGIDIFSESNKNYLPLRLYNEYLLINKNIPKILYLIIIFETIIDDYMSNNFDDIDGSKEKQVENLFKEISSYNIDENFKSHIVKYKKYSINQKIKCFIKNFEIYRNYGESKKDTLSFINECYNIRSKYVHQGEYIPRKQINLDDTSKNLDRLVKICIEKYFNR